MTPEETKAREASRNAVFDASEGIIALGGEDCERFANAAIDAYLSALSSHPDEETEWERAVTTGPRKQWDDEMRPPEGEGWEPDPDRGNPGESWERFDYHEERYWRRRRVRTDREAAT